MEKRHHQLRIRIEIDHESKRDETTEEKDDGNIVDIKLEMTGVVHLLNSNAKAQKMLQTCIDHSSMNYKRIKRRIRRFEFVFKWIVITEELKKD